jgi:hypothetical protein
MARAMSLTGSWLNDVVLTEDVELLSLSEGDASNDGSMLDALLVLWLWL